MYSLFLVFFFICLCFCFLSCLFCNKYKTLKKFSSDYWGGQKRGLPHLNYWGRAPGLPPRVYAYGPILVPLRVLIGQVEINIRVTASVYICNAIQLTELVFNSVFSTSSKE